MINKHFKSPKLDTRSGRIKLSDSGTAEVSGDTDYPIFCFKHLHKSHNIKELVSKDRRFPKDLLNKMETLTQMKWTDIQFSSRKGAGSEKISRKSLKKEPPRTVTDDVIDFLSFYFSGDKGRIIGYRGENGTFHIVFIDTDLSLYSH